MSADAVGKVDVYKLGAGLDQPPGEQHALSVRMPAVGVAYFIRLLCEIKGVAHLRRVQHSKRSLVVSIQAAGTGGVVEQSRLLIDELLQLASRGQSLWIDVCRQAQLRQGKVL